MPQNPFEAPRAPDYELSSRPRHEGSGTFDIGRCLTEAWQATWDTFPLWLGIGVVAVIVVFAAAMTIIGYFLILPVIAWGGVLFLLNAIDGRAAFNDLFAGFSRYGQALGTFLGLGLALIATYVPGTAIQIAGTFSNEPSLALLGAGIAMALMALLTSRLVFAPFYAVDQGLGVADSLRASWTVTGAQKLNVIGLVVLSGVVAVLGLFALIIGAIPSTVIAYMMYASAYRQIAGKTP